MQLSKKLFFFLLTLAAAGVAIVIWKASTAPQITEPLVTTSGGQKIESDLGGMRVSIPPEFANFVEFDDDPGFGEKHDANQEKRKNKSSLRSFGFYARYPDMAGLTSPELVRNKASFKPSNTPWISVGINSGKNYPGDGYLDRRAHAVLEESNETLAYANYKKEALLQFGLTVYTPAGIDSKTNQPHREHLNAEDIFIHRDEGGKVDSYIRCSNRHVSAAPCTHSFTLYPKAKADIYVSYRRDELAKWKEVQESVRQLIFSFEVKPTDQSR